MRVRECGVVAVCGDWGQHSRLWGEMKVEQAANAGATVLFQLGDFGANDNTYGAETVQVLDEVCVRRGVDLMVTPGNHENWDYLYSLAPEDRDDGWGPVWWLGDRVGVFPPASRFTLRGSSGVRRSFLSLGGAPSVNFEVAREGKDWWRSEALSESDVVAAVADGHVDVMLAHDSPGAPWWTGTVETIVTENIGGFSDAALVYAAEGREKMTRVYETVRPWWFFHGHYHEKDATPNDLREPGRPSWVVGLAKEHTRENMVFFDVNSLGLIGEP